MNEFDDFLNSLEARKHKPMMCHKPSYVRLAEKIFEGYLTEEELSERQYVGRFWTVGASRCEDYLLYIILDNEAVLEVIYNHTTGDYKETPYDKVSIILPDELRGYHYD